ncbi:hypothetical protein STM14_1976 [Salmonella enterica subsp. enterica serovar Typhimurium str. 14028S]|uniref:Uncharacterized protein n=1 Tax=Salmonella typhimurium (strain 14028s / SGSC 2262) TaxID=588858 RepID=A0A0F6B1R0_SALT1|nr:hypothetical protein STM14_1976 [Salmonella enterica subsp. enterica serovar Typhimurium str. 14028S]
MSLTFAGVKYLTLCIPSLLTNLIRRFDRNHQREWIEYTIRYQLDMSAATP